MQINRNKSASIKKKKRGLREGGKFGSSVPIKKKDNYAEPYFNFQLKSSAVGWVEVVEIRPGASGPLQLAGARP